MNATNPILLASSNAGKLSETKAILRDLPYTCIALDLEKITLPEETGETFVENALIKARAACNASGLPAIADDSGLIVPALDGAPGIYSARFAGSHATDKENCDKLLQTMRGFTTSQRQAYFHCTFVFMRHANDPVPLIAEGSWHGIIAETPQGDHGFGYDPLFYIPALGCTSASLSMKEKNTLSHRAMALNQLKVLLMLTLDSERIFI